MTAQTLAQTRNFIAYIDQNFEPTLFSIIPPYAEPEDWVESLGSALPQNVIWRRGDGVTYIILRNGTVPWYYFPERNNFQ